MMGTNKEEKIVHKANRLFRTLENYGPDKAAHFLKSTLDIQLDTRKRKDLYHCHLSEGKCTYVVLWEVDRARRLINIIRMGPHENFNYDPKDSQVAFEHAAKAAEKSGFSFPDENLNVAPSKERRIS